ncbi:MAG: DUF192 domain-containing protein [Synechococcaceae cyanobacterium]|jgi:uncharacterized membrane protein (UPF0127 family)
MTARSSRRRRVLAGGGLTLAAAGLVLAAGGGQRSLAGPPQFLPLTGQWCLAGGGPCLELEVPEAEEQYFWGLQKRPRLPPLRGMWFRFSPPSQARFWMHLTPEPLDMVFVRGGRVVAIETALPCPRLPCRSYGPFEPVDGVVELAAGEAARLGIRVGSEAQPRRLPAVAPAAPARD